MAVFKQLRKVSGMLEIGDRGASIMNGYRGQIHVEVAIVAPSLLLYRPGKEEMLIIST